VGSKQRLISHECSLLFYSTILTSQVNEDDAPGIDWFAETDRLLVMQMCIKLADINGPCKRHDIHVQWTHRIAEEFYEQGDDEARLGLPVSPFMDRRYPQLAKLQESFINHLVAPLCNSYAEAGLLPGLWESLDSDTGNGGNDTNMDMPSSSNINNTGKTSSQSRKESFANTRGGHMMSSGEMRAQQFKRTRKVVCLQTKHLQENYEVWISILKEEKSSGGQNTAACSSSSSSSDDSSTPVFNQAQLEGIVEGEESETSSEGSSSGNVCHDKEQIEES